MNAPGGAHPLNAQAADSSSHWLTFKMPEFHALPGRSEPDSGNPLRPGWYRYEVGISTQSPVWKDSVAARGPAWGRDVANFGKWREGAQVYVLTSGYAHSGDSVRVRLPLVASLSWPYTAWARACTDSCQEKWAKVGHFNGN